MEVGYGDVCSTLYFEVNLLFLISDSVNSVAAHLNNSLFLSGSMDGTAKLWNSSNGKNVGTLLCGARNQFLILSCLLSRPITIGG